MIKFRRSFLPYWFYSGFILSNGIQIRYAEGSFLLIYIFSTIIITAGLLWLIIHPSMIIIQSVTVHVYKHFFRHSKFNLSDIRYIDTSGSSFLHAKLVFHDGRKPIPISLWDISEKSFKNLGNTIGVPVS